MAREGGTDLTSNHSSIPNLEISFRTYYYPIMIAKINDEIVLLERLALNTHPPLKTQVFDGWTAGFTEGYTGRANSVLPLETGTLPLETKIHSFEEMYAKQHLPCRFKMTSAAPQGLQDLLENKGYEMQNKTDVLHTQSDNLMFLERLESVEEPEEIGVIITSNPDNLWLSSFFEFEKIDNEKYQQIAKKQFKIVDKNQNLSALYCRLLHSGKDVGVASAVIQNGVLFLLNVVISQEFRGKGFGKILIKEILENACILGAKKLYLQVVQSNSVAQSLYKSFGFEYLYSYWYMEKSQN